MRPGVARHGLCLGKFAPLHRGHQLLIETALSEVETLTVLIYDSPEVTQVPLSVRAAWIRDLYPSVRVIEVVGAPAEVGNAPAVREAHERFVIESLGIRGITDFYSSEFYGEHMSRALGARDRRVDPDRRQVPVSGRLIRADPFRWRSFIHPRVYRDLVINVALLGAPSAGKTTLAASLAREFETVWMPEYGREYWERHHVNRRLAPRELLEIAVGIPSARALLEEDVLSHEEAVERIISAIRLTDADAYAELFAEDAVLEHPLSPDALRGRAAIREGEQGLFHSFSDVGVDVRSLTSEGSRVVAEVVLRATNTGPIDLGEGEVVPATGRRIEIAAAWVFEFSPGGLVVSERDYFDTAVLMAQLGIGS